MTSTTPSAASPMNAAMTMTPLITAVPPSCRGVYCGIDSAGRRRAVTRGAQVAR
jgi:hypothetical protein